MDFRKLDLEQIDFLKVVALESKGKHIHAIKLRREQTGEGLKAAKEFCDEVRDVLRAENAVHECGDCSNVALEARLNNAYLQNRRQAEVIEATRNDLVCAHDSCDNLHNQVVLLKGVILEAIKKE